MKKRHIKTIPEKYGFASIKEEVDGIIKHTKWEDRMDKSFFEKLPHIGIFYIPFDYDHYDLIYSREDGDIITDDYDLIKAKVIEVTEDKFTYIHYDDHHRDICTPTIKHDKWLIEGNIIIKKEKNA